MENVTETTKKRLPQIVEVTDVGKLGLTTQLIERTENKALYKRQDGVFEVFKIKTRQAETVFGYSYPKREIYPKNKDFGKTAWCFNKEKYARKRYNKI